MGELGTYDPFNYPRLCDVCGNRRRIGKMSKLPGAVWVCESHKDERIAVELDRLNAKKKPYNIIPVPNAKPGSQYPDVMEAEEAVIMNFVDRMVVAGTRYEQIISGQPVPVSGEGVAAMAWAGRYLYTVITDTRTPARVVTHAKGLLLSIASQLRARQQGFGLSASSTRANDAFYGGFFDSGGFAWFSDTAAVAGLAMLYAYRVFGTTSYLVSARAAASFLRNVQAIGSNGTFFTSSDSAGTARLNTGGLVSYILNNANFAPSYQIFPSCLVTLQFWNELTTTDGDQSIGATAAVTGFASIPAQLMSTSMTQLRACWTNGIAEVGGTVVNGLSASTPREFFYSYPSGTGQWWFQNGNAIGGTTVSSLNFATALMALYAYEGATTQVTEIDDWMRGFTSNPSFETAENTSAYTLARATTGDYDATVCPATLLQVRDASASYAASSLNGSSVYDWGAFGLLSPLWSSRHGGTFASARASAFGKRERFSDGSSTDGDYVDWISLLGLSGLSYQTASVRAGNALNDVVGSSMFGVALHQRPVAQAVP